MCIIGILGGCSMEKETLTREQQDNVVRWIARNYNVESIEFMTFNKDLKTGSYHLRFKLNKDQHSGITVNTLSEFDNSYESVRLGALEDFRDISRHSIIPQNEEVDISHVEVTYLGE
ncbi:hypothetical protein BU200_10330 [Streptococcus acidominimus]|uniref:Uncharacterized protein n=2 Tax=Streptococcus acidominimus TaxID=1326 RepID=A0A1Q8E5R5_STRAI|nr:hypothetical protein BU200_10330 [Streptococcus acidominimus]